MPFTLEDVVRATEAVPAGEGMWMGHCPAPGHTDSSPSLEIKRGDKQPVIYVCRSKRCPQQAITAALRKKIAAPAGKAAPAAASALKPKPTTKEWGWPDKWQPLTEETYQAIAASRAHSYTPKLGTLRLFGFRERHCGKKLGLCFAYPIYRTWGDKVPALVKLGTVAVDAKGKRGWKQFAPTPAVPQDMLVCSEYSLSNPDADTDVLVVEGQWDALYLCELGYSAVGLLSSAQRTLSEMEIERLGNADRVFFLPDNDPSNAGHEAMEAISGLIPFQASPVVVEIPATTAKDMCQLRKVLGSDDAVRAALNHIIAQPPALPAKEKAAKLADMKRRRVLITQRMSDFVPKSWNWLWEKRLLSGGLNMLLGLPDAGKGLTLVNIAATVTTGRDWMDGRKNETSASEVLYMGTEDSQSVIWGRLKAAGADLDKLVWVSGVSVRGDATKLERMLCLKDDLEEIEYTFQQHPNARLIILDPITAYLGQQVKRNVDDQVRAVLDPFSALAEKYNVTIVGIHHFNKQPEMSAALRASGAGAFQQCPRVVWACVKDADDEATAYMLCAKCNYLSPTEKEGYRYTFGGMDVLYPDGKLLDTGFVKYVERAGKLKLDDVLQRKPKGESSAGAAELFIENHLADGAWHDSDEMERAAITAGVAPNTYKKARAAMGSKGSRKVQSTQEGGKWISRLRGGAAPAASPEPDGSIF